RGYRFKSGKKAYESPALWHGQWEPIFRSMALGFRDLIEIRFVDAFLKSGVSWVILRQAHERGKAMFNVSHPFCTQRFMTDGRQIFVELHNETGEPSLIEIARQQTVFRRIVKPLLLQLEFARPDEVRCWPLGLKHAVVLDPTRSFGRQIIA